MGFSRGLRALERPRQAVLRLFYAPVGGALGLEAPGVALERIQQPYRAELLGGGKVSTVTV